MAKNKSWNVVVKWWGSEQDVFSHIEGYSAKLRMLFYVFMN